MASDPLVLVSGASGFIATHVVKQLQEAGYRVRGTVRSLKDEKKVQYLYDIVPNAKHKIELVEADLQNPGSWTDAVKGCTYVMHVASPFPASNPKHEDELIKPAVEGTLNVLRAVSAAKCVKRVVVTSSTAAVSEKGGNKIPFDENKWTDVTNPNLQAYGKSKTMAEQAAWDYVKGLPDEDKFEICTINPTVVLGPPLHKTSGTSVEIMTNLLDHKVPLVPKFNFPVCDVRDVARAHVVAMTLPEAAGHRHIINSYNVWFMEMAQIVADEFKGQGYNVSTRPLPGFVISLASVFSSQVRMAVDFAGSPLFLDNYRFTKVLGITPIELKKSLIDMGYGTIEHGFVNKTKKYRGAQYDFVASS